MSPEEALHEIRRLAVHMPPGDISPDHPMVAKCAAMYRVATEALWDLDEPPPSRAVHPPNIPAYGTGE